MSPATSPGKLLRLGEFPRWDIRGRATRRTAGTLVDLWCQHPQDTVEAMLADIDEVGRQLIAWRDRLQAAAEQEQAEEALSPEDAAFVELISGGKQYQESK